MLNIEQIQKILPQKPPFLMIDRVIEIEPGKKLVAIKNVTINDQVMSVHFTDKPVMPGSLIIESMAQAGILLYRSIDGFQPIAKVNYFLGSVKAHFFKPVFPGDQIKLEAVLVKMMPKGLFMQVTAFVEEEKVAEADLVCMVER